MNSCGNYRGKLLLPPVILLFCYKGVNMKVEWLKDKRKLAKYALIVLLAVCFTIFLWFYNRVDIVPLQNTEGTSYEKARVIRIIEDNLLEDGTRAGTRR